MRLSQNATSSTLQRHRRVNSGRAACANRNVSSASLFLRAELVNARGESLVDK